MRPLHRFLRFVGGVMIVIPFAIAAVFLLTMIPLQGIAALGATSIAVGGYIWIALSLASAGRKRV